MPQEMQPVRQPLIVHPRGRRTVDERLALRFPRGLNAAMRAVLTMRTRSRFRRVLLRFAFQREISALNRGDHGLVFSLFASDCVSDFSPGFASLGFQATRRLEDRIRSQEQLRADLGDYRFDPAELIDLGDDRVLVVGRFRARGPNSGVPIDTEWGALVTFASGRVVRERTFWNHEEALRAAGVQGGAGSQATGSDGRVTGTARG